MSYVCGPADWIDLAVGTLEDAKRSLRERDRLRQGATRCDRFVTCRDVCGIVNVDIDEVHELIRHIEPEPVTGSTSDGYHTFDELYHHRAVLFSVIVPMFRGRSWKSLHHHDGTMYDGMFIVGVDTPAGPATYHYDVEPYWDMFPCRVLDRAPEWDGRTPDDAIERIGTLRDLLQAEVKEEGSEK